MNLTTTLWRLVTVVCIALVAASCGGSDEAVQDDLGTEAFDEEAPASFRIDGDQAEMVGVIGSSTPDAVQDLLEDHPQVTTIVMRAVPGSEDDESNLVASRLVRRAGLTTHVPANGVIASGGVDFFLAGATRTYATGAQFGVHSWSTGEDGFNAADLGQDDEQHDLFLDYYDEIGVAEDFYWFTLDAAPPESIHFMTAAELDEHEFATQ